MNRGSRGDFRATQRIFVVAVMVCIPLALNACGNPLNGEKLRIFGDHADDHRLPGQGPHVPPPVPGAATGKIKDPNATKPTEGGSTSCQIQTAGPDQLSHKDLLDFNEKVANTVKSDPDRKELITQIGKFLSEHIELNASGSERKLITDLVLDTKTEPAPEPGPKSSVDKPSLSMAVSDPAGGDEAPQPKPQTSAAQDLAEDTTSPAAMSAHPLHAAIVAWVAFQEAVEFAKQEKLELTSNEHEKSSDALKKFSIGFLKLKTDRAVAVVVYKKAFAQAKILFEGKPSAEGKTSTQDAQSMVGAIFGGYPDEAGIGMLLKWILNYEDAVALNIDAKTAIAEANKALCYDPSQTGDKRYLGQKPVTKSAATPAAAKTPKPSN